MDEDYPVGVALLVVRGRNRQGEYERDGSQDRGPQAVQG